MSEATKDWIKVTSLQFSGDSDQSDTLVFTDGGTAPVPPVPPAKPISASWDKDDAELDFASADSSEADYGHDGSVDYLLGTCTLDAHTSSDFFLV